MSKYRVCPNCNAYHGLKVMECHCGYELEGLPTVDGDTAVTERNDAVSHGAVATAEKALSPEDYAIDGILRICDCGAPNYPNVRKCRACGEDIGHILPTVAKRGDHGRTSGEKATAVEGEPDQKATEGSIQEDATNGCVTGVPTHTAESPQSMSRYAGDEPTEWNETVKLVFLLESFDGLYRFRVPQGETVVGRARAMEEYLRAKPYVSRVHCKLILENDELFVVNMSKTNYTFCGNQRINAKLRLKDGDEIGLGGILVDGKPQDRAAYFRVRIFTE